MTSHTNGPPQALPPCCRTCPLAVLVLLCSYVALLVCLCRCCMQLPVVATIPRVTAASCRCLCITRSASVLQVVPGEHDTGCGCGVSLHTEHFYQLLPFAFFYVRFDCSWIQPMSSGCRQWNFQASLTNVHHSVAMHAPVCLPCHTLWGCLVTLSVAPS